MLNATSVLLNVLFSIVLMQRYGILGISSATTIATFSACIVYIVVIGKRIGWDKKEFSIKKVLALLILNSATFIAIYFLKNNFTFILLKIGVSVSVGLLILALGYLAIFWDEVKWLLSKILCKIKKID